ncbi:MAG: alpha/beta hydrolase family protein [Planctomycetaceae bacterium]
MRMLAIAPRYKSQLALLVLWLVCSGVVSGQSVSGPQGTAALTLEGDLASQMVDGLDRFLLGQIAAEAGSRPERLALDVTSADALQKSQEPQRQRLAKILGVTDPRLPFTAPEIIAPAGQQAQVATADSYSVFAVRWPVLGDPSPQGQGLASIVAEGLLLEPSAAAKAAVVVIPDAGQTPEQLAGLQPGLEPAQQTARLLAEAGCRVVVPAVVSRQREKRLNRADLTQREYLHRAAFELGRTLAGYEVQTVLSVVDWYSRGASKLPTGVYGHGEGGMEALFAAALDSRIQVCGVSGFFGPREQSWREPIDRNFFGLLRHFGAAELAALTAPRSLLVIPEAGPALVLEGNGGAPAELRSPDAAEAATELQRAQALLGGHAGGLKLLAAADRSEVSGWTGAFLQQLAGVSAVKSVSGLRVEAALADRTEGRERRLIQQIDRHTQLLLRESPFVRDAFMSRLDYSSVEAYEKSAESYREIFRKDVIGQFDLPLLPFNAKSRKSWETDLWTGHEVVLDVFPDVMAYGVLLLPKDLKPGERRPVVVCQHGLEGRPTDVFLNDNPAYHDFAAKLCERGFITFAPQNPYIFTDRFRTLQRKAQPLGKTLFSMIVPQHQQIVNWLKTQPFVDDSRIAFYGLSYGGKSAMRIPALVTDYCLSICSADFNEWVLKNASTRHNFTYMWTGEYEIFEWDLGSTFNYAEMAALICPRPFMVERGHFDGVGTDDWVGYEYGKVRHLYAAKLKLGERTEIEWFVGPHTINGNGTYQFLHRHLSWPERK